MARLLQSGVLTALWAVLLSSLYVLFTSTDAFAQFIIAGIIPGTDYQLSFWQMSLLLALPLGVISYWLGVLRQQMAEHMLAIALQDETNRQLAASAIPAETKTVPATLEIDELDAVSI